MPKDRSLVRASDLGAWAFCNRSWWLREMQGAEHNTPEVLDRGNAAHKVHGQQVRGAKRFSTAGAILLVAGLLAIGLLILWQLMG